MVPPTDFLSLDPFEPVVIDPTSAFRTARQLNTADLRMVPAAVFYYLQDETKDKEFWDVAALLGTAAAFSTGNTAAATSFMRFVMTLERSGAVLELAAQVIDANQTDDRVLQELRNTLNVSAAALGFSGLGLRLGNAAVNMSRRQWIQLLGAAVDLDNMTTASRALSYETALLGLLEAPATTLRALQDYPAIRQTLQRMLLQALEELQAASHVFTSEQIALIVRAFGLLDELVLPKVIDLRLAGANQSVIEAFIMLPTELKVAFWTDFRQADADFWSVFNGLEWGMEAWEFFHTRSIADRKTDIEALEIFSRYRGSEYSNYEGWSESVIRRHLDDVQNIPELRSRFREDTELIEEWESLRGDDELIVTDSDLQPSSKYWPRATELEGYLGRRFDINETGGFSNSSNLPGYGVLNLDQSSPSPSTAFSGVFDVQEGRVMIYPSAPRDEVIYYSDGTPIPEGHRVDRRGGHRTIRTKMIEYFDDLTDENSMARVVGFTIKYENVGEWQVEFFSRSCNHPFNRNATGVLDLNDPSVPTSIRPDIIDALNEEFNNVRGYNLSITGQ